MIFVKLKKEKNYYISTLIHYKPFHEKFGLGKSEEELLQEGVLVEYLPDYYEIEEGFILELRASLDSKELYYSKKEQLL